jgi:hypothetical protein
VVNEHLNGRVPDITTNFQSEYSLLGFGHVRAGKARRMHDNPSPEVFEIFRDNLLFRISHGGASGLGNPGVEFKLIWNGVYYDTPEGLTVDLVFSFKNLDNHRALIHRYIRFDLTRLQSPDSKVVNINFVGYKLIKYVN